MDVVEMNDARRRGIGRFLVAPFPFGNIRAELTQQIGDEQQYNNDERDEHVAFGEEGDALRDGIVRHDTRQQFRFACPAKLRTLRCQLHPNGIDAVVRHHAEVGHHQSATLLDDERISKEFAGQLLRLLPKKFQAVGLYLEIIVERVVAAFRIFLVVAAAETQQQQHPNDISHLLHRHLVTLLPCHLVTLLPCYFVTLSPCHFA